MKSYLITMAFFISTSSIAQKKEEVDPLELNKKVVAFIMQNSGKKVGEGENVDLNLEALKAAKAKWNFKTETEFGEQYDPSKTKIEPGDMIQMDNAEYENKTTKDGWKFGNNSLIVVQVESNNVIQFATQNLFNKRFVTFHKLELDTLNKGKAIFYRPIKP